MDENTAHEYGASFQIEQRDGELVATVGLKLDLADRLSEATEVIRRIVRSKALDPAEEPEGLSTQTFLLDLRPVRASQESQGRGPDRERGEKC